tara:strand:+ start:672 stop:1070 length:399 start_codon:yes stop_codon:yes gene_type:complete
MKTLKQNKISELFYRVIKKEEQIDSLVKEIKKNNLNSSVKYAYKAFCCAMLSKNSDSYLQKGKYIKQYGLFITKSFEANSNCIEARLIRLLIEQKLENVKFVNHTSEDLNFLNENYDSVEDNKLKEIISNII